MKVLHLGKYYPPEPGGIEYVLKHLLEATSRRFENRAVVAAKSGPHREERGPGYAVFRRREIGTLFLTPIVPGLPLFLHGLRREHAFDVIVLHAPNPMTLLALFASSLLRPLRERLVVFYHADILLSSPLHRLAYALFRPVEEALFRRADLFIATSPNMAAFSPVLRRYAGKVRVVPLMVPDGWGAPTPDEEAEAGRIRSRFGGRPIVLFVGRLIPYKGLDTLVAAAPRVRDAVFLVVGDGPLEASLRRQAEARGVADRVVFEGRAASLKPYYLACDVLVLPSNSPLEAFGLVQLEAMAFGKPAVTSDLPTGVTWANLEGITGLTFPVGDCDRLAEALGRILSDGALRERLGLRAKERVEKEFTASTVGATFERVILDLLGEGRTT